MPRVHHCKDTGPYPCIVCGRDGHGMKGVAANREWSEFAWAVGLFEGEGSITMGRGKSEGYPYIQVSLTSTDGDVVFRFQKAIGLGYVRGPVQQKDPRHKMKWTWSKGGDACTPLLREMMPFLSERRRARANEVIEIRQKALERKIAAKVARMEAYQALKAAA